MMIYSSGYGQISMISHRAWRLQPIQPSVNRTFNSTGDFFIAWIKNFALSAFPPHTSKCITASLWLRPAASSRFLTVIQSGASPAGTLGQMRFSKSAPVRVHERIS